MSNAATVHLFTSPTTPNEVTWVLCGRQYPGPAAPGRIVDRGRLEWPSPVEFPRDIPLLLQAVSDVLAGPPLVHRP